MTIREHRGRLQGQKLCYIGDGNNMTNSLIVGGIKMGMKVSVACPNGYTPDAEIMKWAEVEVDKFATYFYADNLDLFKLSGRVSNFSAIMGTLFGVHPIITMNSEGKMVSVAKCKGKNKTLNKLVDYFSFCVKIIL